VGVLDGEEYSEPDEGTAQGSVLSPVLGNIYLHHVLVGTSFMSHSWRKSRMVEIS